MESEKVKEIKKVLEEGQFNTITHHQHEGKPIKISFADILTLINELQKEVKTRKEEVLHLQEYGKKLIRESELKQFAEWLAKRSNNNIYLELVKEFLGINNNENKCIACGADIPEGRQVCPNCEKEVSND